MTKFSNRVERASIDEAYIDVTDEAEQRLKATYPIPILANHLCNTYVAGWAEDENAVTANNDEQETAKQMS